MKAIEAKGKVCPVAQTVCVASKCMMWRWEGMGYMNPEKGTEEQTKNCEGFCGLAGQPIKQPSS